MLGVHYIFIILITLTVLICICCFFRPSRPMAAYRVLPVNLN